MTFTSALSARSLAAATPVTRDRYADFLRVLSIGVVVAGHWLMAVVTVGATGPVSAGNVSVGNVSVGNALTSVPGLQYATWVFQVMPLFFFVGGFAHYTALGSLARCGGSYAEFVRSRVTRLLRPTAVFVAVWMSVAIGLEVTGRQTGVLALAVRTVAQPLWFLGVYVGVMALAPPMLRLHRRHGVRVPLVLGLAAVVIDGAAFGLGLPALRLFNVAVVWLAVHQLGYLYADGTLLRSHRIGLGMVAGGLGTVVLLTACGAYPVSMVGMPGEAVSNMNPPTVALLAHAGWLIGLALLLRGPVSRWLSGARVWTGVVAANAVVMTVFLWHLTALFAGYAVWLGLGGALPVAGTPAWWLTRPLWLACLGVLCVALVAVFRRAERPRVALPPAGPGRSGVSASAAAACCVGILGLSAVGFGGILAGHHVTLVVAPMSATVAGLLVLAGWVVLAYGCDNPPVRTRQIGG